MTDDAHAPEPTPSRLARWRGTARWRRMGRGKPGTALAAAVVGALLGAGLTAWQAGVTPFSGEAACWGSLDDRDLEELPLGSGDIGAQEQPPGDGTAADGSCRLIGGEDRGWEVNVRVHTPTGPYARESDGWHEKFLASDMSPLGGELTGMASAARSWLALPAECTGAASYAPPTVVDVDTGGNGVGEPEQDREMRAVLARVVTRLANGTLAKLGCDDRFEEPERLPALPQPRDASPAAVCGIDGLTVPPSAKSTPELERRSTGDGPVRSCDLGYSDHDVDDLRLLTVDDPGLARILDPVVRDSGIPVTVPEGAPEGYGTLGSTQSAFRTECKGVYVVFLLRQHEIADNPLRTARTLLPRYVRAETERLGCARADMRVPPGPAA
ncbi:hypothetical protein DVA86_22130 [Streptomyces armeniacus]|uniref:Uncharacterized protein n=1 Tax=Streptomyces armeniacus TaxID=83291 RepID=A0A345XTH1_9ACTN|nr:hypothetical protein [Streptomyces armeniacus]AXK34937.1 hypothetical protein DVA86_22130 [Streptomyces armeniacus]